MLVESSGNDSHSLVRKHSLETNERCSVMSKENSEFSLVPKTNSPPKQTESFQRRMIANEKKPLDIKVDIKMSLGVDAGRAMNIITLRDGAAR